MAKGSEKRLVWDPLREQLNILHWDHQRFEDKLTVGIPDLNIHTPNQGDIWVEMKYVSQLSPVIELGLSREQYIWMKRGQQAGRCCYLLVRIGNTGWYLWNDTRTWELAKKPAQWKTLVQTAARHSNPAAVLVYLNHP